MGEGFPLPIFLHNSYPMSNKKVVLTLMAKDDYNVIVNKVLTYLYAVFKRKIVFDDIVFEKSLDLDITDKRYFDDILRYIQKEDYISGLVFTKVWGNEYVLVNNYRDMAITHNGIQYLTENGTMKNIRDLLINGCDIISTLIQMIFR